LKERDRGEAGIGTDAEFGRSRRRVIARDVAAREGAAKAAATEREFFGSNQRIVAPLPAGREIETGIGANVAVMRGVEIELGEMLCRVGARMDEPVAGLWSIETIRERERGAAVLALGAVKYSSSDTNRTSPELYRLL